MALLGKRVNPKNQKARFKGVVETVRGPEFLFFVSSFGGVISWALSAISSTQCVQSKCVWCMCAWLEGDPLFLETQTGNARTVRALPLLTLLVMCKGYGTCECGVARVVSESFAGGNTDQKKTR
jgi:hypothetical protein